MKNKCKEPSMVVISWLYAFVKTHTYTHNRVIAWKLKINLKHTDKKNQVMHSFIPVILHLY